jgi:MOSC domain-containing protein YiiM
VAGDRLDAWEAGLGDVRDAPTDAGRVELIVCRPAVDERRVLEEASFDCVVGMVGDSWRVRPSTSTVDGGPHPDAQVTIASARLMALIAGPPEQWPPAGDQLFVDLDLSVANLPPGTRLSIGSAVLEVSAKPHTGCAKFSRRFGADALRLVNSPVGKELRLRGLNATVVRPGSVQRGDQVVPIRDGTGRGSERPG